MAGAFNVITRYHCYYTNDFGYDYPAFSREDAEAFARDDEDAWHIVEHMWPAIDAARAGHE